MATVVLDNGAYTAKVGYFADSEPRLIPNCVIKAKTVRNRVFIGDQVDDCKDLSGLFYLLAFQKGYLVNGEIEKKVWDYIYGKDVLKVDFNETGLLITEPYFNFTSITEAMTEMFFEEYQFQSIYKCNPSFLSQFKRQSEETHLCCLVVDSGYSFTHIIPYYNGKKLTEGVRRINIGGKVLTNHLKEIISYRQLMVMDETYVVNQMKEDVCYISTQLWKDIDIVKKKGKENTVVRDYILPDYTHIKRGYIKSMDDDNTDRNASQQIIRMNIERFSVPELLFHPSDIGLEEMGIPEAIWHSVSSLPEEMQPHMYGNIVLTGGNCVLPGFKDRLYEDLRALTPDEYDLNIHLPENAQTYAWQGGCQLCKDDMYSSLCVTKQEYDEHGHVICADKFDI
ncbi:Actin-related protein 6 [Lamellibrachia satsuma]|nr:Actin-related protein 6 [Lamellibrachia satsuma]